MKKGKRFLSICITLALGSSNVYAEELSTPDSLCQKDTSELNKTQKDRQSKECQPQSEDLTDNNWGWALSGIAALTAGVAIAIDNNGSGSFHHHNSSSNNDGDDVTPPDDGGNVTPPDDDGGITPPDTGITQYNNNVTLDRGAKTLTFGVVTLDEQSWNDVTFSYVQDGDNYILTAPDGRTLVINKKYVTSDDNAVMEGTQGSTGYYWKYDSQGKFWFASDGTTVISGDGQSNSIDNDSIVAGKGSIGTLISGDDTQNTLNGDISASDGATGAVISGDNTTTTVNGDIYASGGATGLYVSGNDAAVSNNGSITAVDLNSVGVAIAGANASFSNSGTIDSSLDGTGVSISGDDATVMLDGTVNVHGAKAEDGSYPGATGVSITGDRSTTTITGDMALTATEAESASTGTLTGLSVTGNDNNVTLNGALAINSETSYFTTEGISVSGSGNNVQVNGGVDLNTTQSDVSESHLNTAINVTGDNTVSISGSSSVNMKNAQGTVVMLANVADGGTLRLNADSILDITLSPVTSSRFNVYGIITATGNGSTIDNQGIINLSGNTTIATAYDGATISNSGTINELSPSQSDFVQSDLLVAGQGGVARNSKGGTINITSEGTPYYHGGANIFPVRWYGDTSYAMLATNYGQVENQDGATINLNGAGLYGVAASQGTASNAGTINVDGFIPTVDENGNITGKTFWQYNDLATISAGVVVGSTDRGYGDASGLNTGTINVNNEGFGMLALSGGTVTNQGTINLTADDGVTASASNQLIGMGVINGGMAINDQTGVININADYGQAFYNDGSGVILNYGQINLNGSELADDDSHMGSQPTNEYLLPDIITSAGQTQTLDSATGFASLTTGGANYGNVTLNGDLRALYWLWNEGADSVLNVNGDITVAQGLENQGSLTADTITTASNVYNRAGATMSVDTLSAPQFFNEGDFSGTVTTGGSYTSNLVNSGTMSVTQDGNAVFSGTASIYNQAGATITNSAQAVTGGENTLIHITRTGGADTTLVNDGTLLAQNGYSAITVDQSGTTNAHQWFINSETGVISGTNPQTPLVSMGRGYNFANEGTISVQGDNAVGISGATTSYTQYLVNSGTLNVGTEEGQTDGSNGTGLVGMQGNGKGTVINNAADGVINIYADDSYAFGGTTQRIINNGEVNLLCDTGCGLYAPGTKGIQNDHDGTTDVSVTAASTAPSQGTVPTAPTESGLQSVSGYTVGTNADGSAGVLTASNVQLSDVNVNTGFTAGTDATTMTFDNVVTGSNIQGADTITSTSVVWTAQGSNDASGNVDVTMTKNAYVDVATDNTVNSVASALDAGYTNNELYTSLNVSTTAELNNALKQISGGKATSVFNEARMLSNRFDMLTNAAPVQKNGLAMNLIAKDDPRAELGKNTQYDMLALRQKLELTSSQSISLEYGIARLDGDNSTLAGDNSITGGYSQFFGLKHEMAFENGLSWNNDLRYDMHDLDSNRAISYNGVSKSADSSVRQQYMELRSSAAKKFELTEGLTVTPYAGVKLRHTVEDGYNERNAGDFNLTMNSGSETAVDGIAGLKLNYASENGWSAMATLEGGPNLSYAKSQRSASLQGAIGQKFNVDDGQKGGGVNSLGTVGVKYSSKDHALAMEAFHWKEDGISDKGMMMNYKLSF